VSEINIKWCQNFIKVCLLTYKTVALTVLYWKMTRQVIPGSVRDFYMQLLNGCHICREADLGSAGNRTPKSHTPKLVAVARPVHEVFGMLAHMEQRVRVNFFHLWQNVTA
jgi:hypothetical protein